MGSYKRGYKSPNMAYISIVTLIITPFMTTHEPPSRAVILIIGSWKEPRIASFPNSKPNLAFIREISKRRYHSTTQQHQRAFQKESISTYIDLHILKPQTVDTKHNKLNLLQRDNGHQTQTLQHPIKNEKHKTKT